MKNDGEAALQVQAVKDLEELLVVIACPSEATFMQEFVGKRICKSVQTDSGRNSIAFSALISSDIG